MNDAQPNTSNIGVSYLTSNLFSWPSAIRNEFNATSKVGNATDANHSVP